MFNFIYSKGFFILVFGTLLDGKIRGAIASRFSSIVSISDRTRSTSVGATASSTTSAMDFLRRRVIRNAYNISQPGNASSSNIAT
ncbi:hypothetical protein UPYG_G00253010 [Umbra pygmaea]|uniref:Secreted protein n=1 Tax=Umbra pygmaea TaxID=75934 RepID=A0ABD0WXV5_UMBPY